MKQKNDKKKRRTALYVYTPKKCKNIVLSIIKKAGNAHFIRDKEKRET